MTTESISRNPGPLVNPKYEPLVHTAAIATGLAALSLYAPIEALRIIGTTVLTGVGYGIANDMIACRDCIEYFTVGHFFDGKNLENRPINTLDPTLNALTWGPIATWHVCAVAGAFFALLCRLPFPGLAVKITAAQLSPYFALGAGITFILAHMASRAAQQKMAQKPFLKYEGVPLNYQAGWEACNIRNSTGYVAIPLFGALSTIPILAARIGLFGY